MPAPLVERHDETARGLGARREAVVDQRARRAGACEQERERETGGDGARDQRAPRTVRVGSHVAQSSRAPWSIQARIAWIWVDER